MSFRCETSINKRSEKPKLVSELSQPAAWKRALKGVKQIREGRELHLCKSWKVGRAAVDLAMEIGH